MKTFPAVLLALGVAAASGAAPALAHDCSITLGDCRSLDPDAPLRWAGRHDVGEARLAITTTDGSTTLILTRGVVAMQLSDRYLHRIDRKMVRDAGSDDDEDACYLGHVIRDAVLTVVRQVLDHSLECPVARVRDAEYRHGRLVLTTENGHRMFRGVRVEGRDVLESFSPEDAQAFVREFDRLTARGG